VIEINPVSNTAQKCTLCYDRLQSGMEPACSQACPTDSIVFGSIRELKERARARLAQLHALGEGRARLYGAEEEFLGGLNSFYLLLDEPEVYGLPRNPTMPTRNLRAASLWSLVGTVVLGVLGVLGVRQRRIEEVAARE
jgi:formate dehydrogenase iron-sulfur subunit